MEQSGQDSLLTKREAITPEEQQEFWRQQNRALWESEREQWAQQEGEATVDGWRWSRLTQK
jgi:hypothetical protein